MAGRISRYAYRTQAARNSSSAASSQLSRAAVLSEFRHLVRPGQVIPFPGSRFAPSWRRTSNSIVPLIGKAAQRAGMPVWLAKYAMGEFLGKALERFDWSEGVQFPQGYQRQTTRETNAFTYYEDGCVGFNSPAVQGYGYPAAVCYGGSPADGELTTLAAEAAAIAPQRASVEADINAGLSGVWLLQDSIALNPLNSARVVNAGPSLMLRVEVAFGAQTPLQLSEATVKQEKPAPQAPPYVIRYLVDEARFWAGWGEASYHPPRPRQEPEARPHDARPPFPYEKEEKIIVSAPMWWQRFISALTETDDFVDAALSAIPNAGKRLRRETGGRATTIDKALFVWSYWHEVDWAKFLQALIHNQVEDFVYGRLSKAETEKMRLLFREFGINFSMAPTTKVSRALKQLG